jgi:hypothetical protein
MSWGFSPWAIGPWGSTDELVTRDQETPPTVHGVGMRLTINGIDLTDMLMNDSLKISDEAASRNEMELTLRDDAFVTNIEPGQRVDLTVRTGYLFSGTIEQVNESIPNDIAPTKFVDIECVDWNQLADRHVVAQRYKDMSLRAIVQAIVNQDSGDENERLKDEYVTATDETVQLGPTFSNVAFQYETCAAAFDKLADLSGYTWKINYRRELEFFDRFTNEAPYQIDSTNWTNYRNLTLEKNRENYRNAQIFRAGSGQTQEREQTFTGDGNETTFTLSLPVAEKPEVWLKISPASSYTQCDPATVAVQPDDDEDLPACQWFYTIGGDKVTQNNFKEVDAVEKFWPALRAVDSIQVVYHGQYPLLVEVRNDSEIVNRQNVEGGTGVYYQVDQDEQVDDADLAFERVDKMLSRYSKYANRASFSTDYMGFRSGQWLTVKLPEFGISGKFFIQSVNLEYVADTLFRYTVSAVDSEDLVGWVDFYRKLASNGRPFVYNENEVIHPGRTRYVQLEIGDSVSTTEWPDSIGDDDSGNYPRVGIAKVGGFRGSEADEWDDNGGSPRGCKLGLPTRRDYVIV